MQVGLYIARRYLFAKKSHHIINYISIISVIGVMFTTAALIIVLSVFNGFESLVISLFNSFNPDLVIEPQKGKHFSANTAIFDQVKNTKGVQYFCPIIEENGLIKYKNKQSIVKLKGVDSSFIEMSQFDTLMVQGRFVLEQERENYIVLGYGVAYRIQSRISDFRAPIQVFLPDKSKKASSQLQNSFKQINLFPAGFFSVRQDFDESYVFIPLHLLRSTLGLTNQVTSIEIGVSPNSNKEKLQETIRAIVGGDFTVKNRIEQQSLLLKIMQSEKAIVYLILGFILLIATFNIIGSISMLIVDKKKDINTLKALGAGKQLIIRIFAWEGMMISFAGGLIGLFVGGLISYLQQKYGFISLGNGGTGFVVDAYPVRIIFFDFIKVFSLVVIMSGFSVIYPLRQLSKQL